MKLLTSRKFMVKKKTFEYIMATKKKKLRQKRIANQVFSD